MNSLVTSNIYLDFIFPILIALIAIPRLRDVGIGFTKSLIFIASPFLLFGIYVMYLDSTGPDSLPIALIALPLIFLIGLSIMIICFLPSNKLIDQNI